MFDKYYREIENIEGWFSREDAQIFYETIKNLKGKGAMVEIGSWCGKSLIFSHLVSEECSNKCKKYAIDPFLTSKDAPNGKYQNFIDNLKKFNLKDKIIHIKEKSNIAGVNFKDSIEFLFMDGFHVYEYIKQEFELFSKKVIEGGFILIHDVSSWSGPTKLVYELTNKNNIKLIKFSGKTVLAQKVKDLTPQDRENNIKIANLIKEKIQSNNISLKY